MSLLELGGKSSPSRPAPSLWGATRAAPYKSAAPTSFPSMRCSRARPTGSRDPEGRPEAEVLINGVRLGAEPTPLLHGDKVQVGPNELTFVDERRSGSTQYVEAVNLPQMLAQPRRPKRQDREYRRPGGEPDRRPRVCGGRSFAGVRARSDVRRRRHRQGHIAPARRDHGEPKVTPSSTRAPTGRG